MKDLFMNVLTLESLISKESGKEVLTLLCNLTPDLIPERYGNWEPLKAKFDPANLEHALTSWQEPFLWKRNRPASAGSVWMARGPHPEHGAIDLCAESRHIPYESTLALFRAWATHLNADFAFLHLLCEPEIERGIAAGTVRPLDKKRTKFNFSVTTHILVKYIPDVYWATVFGPSYIRAFGWDRLLSAPASTVQALGPETVYLQLSDNLNDLRTRFDEVEEIRSAVKKHLGTDYFFDLNKGPSYSYTIPPFCFQENKPS